MFYLESFQIIANGKRKFLPPSLFSQLSQDLLCSFKKIALCRRSVVLAKERSGILSQNWNKMRLSQRCPCLHQSWRGNLILKILSCENPSNIWESNYGPQMCGANKLTGKMELVLQLNEWTSLPSHGTFQRYVFMLSTRFVRTSGNNFNCLTKHGATLSSLNISRCTYCSGYDEHACDTIFFS